MRTGLASWAALVLTAIVLRGPASAAMRTPPTTAGCTSSVVFGDPQWDARAMTFRATVSIACPLGVTFSAALRSSNGCEMRSASGGTLRYELFSDEAMRMPVVSCEREASALTGVGRSSFVIYGRVDGPVGATGQFHDALLTSIAP